MPSIKGTSSREDARAHDKLLRSTKFPAMFYNTTTIDPSKVNQAILNVWIDREITALLGFEDEIVSNTATNLFGLTDAPSNEGGGPSSESFDPRNAHIVLSGFLGEEASLKFCTQLLELLVDASQQPLGIPRQLIEEKKRQLMAAAPVVPTASIPPPMPPAPQMPPNDRTRPNRWDSAESGRNNDRDHHRSNDAIDEYGRPRRKNAAVVVVEEEAPTRRDKDHRDRDDRDARRRHHERHQRYDDAEERRRRHGDTHREERYRRPDVDDPSEERHRRRSDREDRDYKRSRRDRQYSRDDHYQNRRESSLDRDHSDREYSRKRHRHQDRDRSP
jgi:PWI domain